MNHSLSHERGSERSRASKQKSECSGARERSKQCGTSEQVSGASKRANGRASGPVLQTVFLAVINHSAPPPLTFLQRDRRLISQKLYDLVHVRISSSIPGRDATTAAYFSAEDVLVKTTLFRLSNSFCGTIQAIYGREFDGGSAL